MAKNDKVVYLARAPLRLGLGGGGSDVSPYSNEHGGCVLNATIDLYAHAILEPSDVGIVFSSTDMEIKIEVDAINILEDIEPLRLHRGVYNYIVSNFNKGNPLSFRLTTFADVPPGSGLGTSSTMVVCIIKVFSEWLELKLSPKEIGQIAYDIERNQLGMIGGKQDQFAAAFGGFNFMEFGPGDSRISIEPLELNPSIIRELEMSTVLFYSGQSRESASIIKHQIINLQSKQSASSEAMALIKKNSVLMRNALLSGNLSLYADLLRLSWLSKRQLADEITNQFLDEIHSAAIQAGAIAGKISGAGGGGFFMFFVPVDKRMNVIRCLQKYQGQVINFHFTTIGVEAWIQHLNEKQL